LNSILKLIKRSKTDPDILMGKLGGLSFDSFFKKLVKMLSDFSLEILKKNEVTVAIYTLRHCEYFIWKLDDVTFPKYNHLKCIVYNYLACCYRRQGNLKECMVNI